MYLGVDYGEKRIGLAYGELYPQGLGIIENNGSSHFVAEKIRELAEHHGAKRIIIGLPISSDGEEGILADKIHELKNSITRISHIPVELEDESFTSAEAEEELKARGISLRNNKGAVDELAAILILEQYINNK